MKRIGTLVLDREAQLFRASEDTGGGAKAKDSYFPSDFQEVSQDDFDLVCSPACSLSNRLGGSINHPPGNVAHIPSKARTPEQPSPDNLWGNKK